MTSFAKAALAAAVAAGALGLAATAHASVTTYTSLSAWEAAVGAFSETTSLGAPDGSSITSFTTTDGVLVTTSGTVDTIGSGWATWSGGYTGQVLNNGGT